MAPAATTAAAVTVYAGAGTALATLATAVGTTGWYLFAGFGKIECPACKEKIRARYFHEHARNHPYDCRACNQSVSFPDMAEHVKTHDHKCLLCGVFVPFMEMEEHVNNHGYPCPRCKKMVTLADMEEHFQIHQAEEDEYTKKRQEVSVLWGFLKAECPICKTSVCLREIQSHAAIHWMEREANSVRQQGLTNMQAKKKTKGLKINSLVCPRTSLSDSYIC